MNAPKKPSCFKFSDTIVPGLCLGIAGVCFAIVPYANEPTEAKWLLALVAVVSLVIGTVNCIKKYKEHADWSYAKFGKAAVMVRLNGYQIDPVKVAAVASETFDNWRGVFGDSKLDDIMANGVLWINFAPYPLKSHGKRVAGYTSAFSRRCYIEFNDNEQPIQETALAHEIGHVIQGEATGSWNQADHHKRSAEANLR